MALANYSDLKASVANWLHRSDLTDQIPDFITMAEARLNRLLQLKTMEQEVPLTMTIGSRFVTLPSGMNTPIACWLETYLPRYRLTNRHPEDLPVTSNFAGPPEYWAIDNDMLAFERPANIAHSLSFRFIKNFDLSDAVPTNALMTAFPDVYLYGTLLESAPYLRDDARIAVWQERFDRAINEVSNNDNDTRAVAPLMTELNMRVGRRFNINRGY